MLALRCVVMTLRKSFGVRLFLVLIAAACASLDVASQTAAPVYPPKVSASGLSLVDQNNRPFFINGESAWSLITQISKQDAELFLENRRQKGYNVLLAMLINHEFTSNAPRNFAGDAPFTTAGDFNTPNEAYFAHADWVINTAAAKGQVIMLTPLYRRHVYG